MEKKRPPGREDTETSEVRLNYIHCESTDEQSENKSTYFVYMLK